MVVVYTGLVKILQIVPLDVGKVMTPRLVVAGGSLKETEGFISVFLDDDTLVVKESED
jgi:hypothetical protein